MGYMYDIYISDTLWTRVWDTETPPGDKHISRMIKKHEQQAAQYYKRTVRKVDRFCWKTDEDAREVVVKVYFKYT